MLGPRCGRPISCGPRCSTASEQEYRLAEEVGKRALAVVNPLMVGPLKRYRSVRTQTVAGAMLACAERSDPGVHIVESEVIQDLGA